MIKIQVYLYSIQTQNKFKCSKVIKNLNIAGNAGLSIHHLYSDIKQFCSTHICLCSRSSLLLHLVFNPCLLKSNETQNKMLVLED